VRATLPPETTDATIAGVFHPAPIGIAGIKDITVANGAASARHSKDAGAPRRGATVIERAERGLVAVAAPLPCTAEKVELGRFEEVTCEDYPLALSLRIADAVHKLPHLRRRPAEAGACPAYRAIDAFLSGLERGTYDPDRILAAAEELRKQGSVYDAGILLTRQRRQTHCGPPLVALSRALGRSAVLEHGLRADLLSVAVNCAVAGNDAAFVDDVVALDTETRTLPDLSRNLRLVLSIADIAQRGEHWELLGKLTAQPRFIERWMNVSAEAATAALAIDHATATLRGQAVAVARTRSVFELLCHAFPAGDRAPLCDRIKLLRAPAKAPSEDQKRAAREALKSLVATAKP
jgi:hypothetical protein